MNKKKLLLDVDEVICFSGYVEAVNDFLKTNYAIDDFTDYYIDEVAIPADKKDDFKLFLRERNLYQCPHILPNAIESIRKLNNYYDIYILSSCINSEDYDASGRAFSDKYNFLRTNLPFLDPNKFIFTNSKNMVTEADVKIDDRVQNFFENEKIPLKILFPSYHNKNIQDTELEKLGITRAGVDWKNGWDEVLNILINDIN